MNVTLWTAIAAAMGSFVGAIASIATTWITQRTQAIRANSEWKVRECETLYKEFVTEGSRLAADAMTHSLERPDQLVALYGVLSRIRLVSGGDVLRHAEACCYRIIELYRRPNLTSNELHIAFEAHELDVLREFSMACRAELLASSLYKGR
ncbi:MAG TPA: hypothetical protein VKD71_08395 [Gemmataceae bacterium]|nr:hypothetical protein [Gemmataceae bacterium]